MTEMLLGKSGVQKLRVWGVGMQGGNFQKLGNMCFT